MKLLKYIVIFIALLSQFAWAESVQITGQWIREAPPTARVLAAFMNIENQASEARTIIAISSPDFDRVEIHQTTERVGMTVIELQNRLIIAAKQQVILKPGSYHFMLMMPKRALSIGDEVELTLKFANDAELIVKIPVLKSAPN